MARNIIQFQPGLILPEFLKQFGTEDQCRRALEQWRWPRGFVCPDCGHTSCWALKGRKLFQCNQCHSQMSLTSGTIFATTKLPLTTWFLAIYMVTQSKNSVSALSLSRTLRVASNTAKLMKHKLQQIMKLRDGSKPLSGFVQIDDLYGAAKNMTATAEEVPPVSHLLLPLYQPMIKVILLKCALLGSHHSP